VSVRRAPVSGARRGSTPLIIITVAALAGALITTVVARDDASAPVSPVAPRISPLASDSSEAPATPGTDAAADRQAVSPAVPQGEPARVVIPAIGVDVALVRLGLRADRSMEVPDFGLAGWYARGPRPGHHGPAVIAGHVDSRAGPDVFFRLGDLVIGDRIHVEYDSGDHVTFIVTRTEQVPKDALPVELIWPLTNDRLLTLITCGGTFDRDVRSYRDNVIVYAAQLDPAGVDAAPEGSSGQR
jgi:sortase (surface protein transpeptidase)